jgi:hypothetical protein
MAAPNGIGLARVVTALPPPLMRFAVGVRSSTADS